MKPARQNIDGVLLLDKPVGWTSNAALQKAKWLLNAAKAGHTGTLDPFASGLLPICLGQATKFSGYALHGDKTYLATLKFGTTTTTGDTEGEVVHTRPVDLDMSRIQAILPRFTGEIQQIPPMYSALKHQGKALYEYARQGIEIERKPRTVSIHAMHTLSLHDDVLVLEVDCSGGTYIRTLAADIGEALGCGAHLIGLRRTRSGALSLTDAITPETLEAQAPEMRTSRLLAPDSLLHALPILYLSTDAIQRLAQGKITDRPPDTLEGLFRAYGPAGFFGIVHVTEAHIESHRLMDTSALLV